MALCEHAYELDKTNGKVKCRLCGEEGDKSQLAAMAPEDSERREELHKNPDQRK